MILKCGSSLIRVCRGYNWRLRTRVLTLQSSTLSRIERLRGGQLNCKHPFVESDSECFSRNWMGKTNGGLSRVFDQDKNPQFPQPHIVCLNLPDKPGLWYSRNFKSSFVSQNGAKLRRAHSSLSPDTIIVRSEDVPRPRKVNFHSASRRWWTAKRDHVAVTEKTKRLYYTRRTMEIENGEGGDWQGCRVFPLASQTAKTTTLYPQNSDYYRSSRLSPVLFRYSRLKCFYPLIMRHRLILHVALLWT